MTSYNLFMAYIFKIFNFSILFLDKNRLKIFHTNFKVRATHAVSRGSWYFEVTVADMPEGSACRIGWGQEYANLQVGFKMFSAFQLK
jgi:hypothetical protein